MNLHYWQYFRAIESDLAATSRFVEPVQANMGCYSMEFARLLLTAGSEVDVLCKVLCDNHGLTMNPENIAGYRTEITRKFPGFTKVKIFVPRYNLSFEPWKDWDTKNRPDWWDAYNNVKHERSCNYAQANLDMTLKAMSALFVLVSYICKKELWCRTAEPWPQLLDLDPTWSHIRGTDLRPGFEIPDFKGTY